MTGLDDRQPNRVIQTASHLAPLLLVVLTMLGGEFYFAGTVYLNTLATLSGLAASPTDGALQPTMAEGARILLSADVLLLYGAICGLCAGAILGAYQIPAVKKLRAKVHRSRTETTASAIPPGWQPSIPAKFATIAFATLVIYLGGYGTSISAKVHAYEKVALSLENTQGSCEDCYLYLAGSELVHGMPIFQNGSQIFVQDRGTLRVIAMEQLKAVTFCNAAQFKALTCLQDIGTARSATDVPQD